MKKHAFMVALFGTALIALLVVDGRRGLAQGGDKLKELKGLFNQATSLSSKGKHAEALPFVDKMVILAPEVFGTDHPTTATILHAGGSIYQSASKYPEAESLYRRTLKIRDAKLPKDDLSTASTLNNLGFILERQSKFQDGMKVLKRCLEIREAKLPENTLELAVTLHNLGMNCYGAAEYVDAEKYFTRSMRINEALYGKEDLRTAGSLHNLSDTYRQMGRFAEAESFAQRSLAIRQAKLGKDHLEISDSLNVLGLIYQKLARGKEAEHNFRAALEIREKHLGKNALAVATSLNNLAIFLGHTDRLDESEKLYRRSLAIRESQLGTDDLGLASTLNNLAVHLGNVGRHEEAEKLLVRSLVIQETKLPKDHPQIASTLLSLSVRYQEQGRWKDAEAYCRRALNIYETRLGKDHIETATAASNLAMLFVARNRLSDAQPLLETTLKIREAHFGKKHPQVGHVLDNLGSVSFRLRDYPQAAKHWQRSLDIAEASYGKDSLDVARVLDHQIRLHYVLGEPEKALKTHDRCLSIHQGKLRNLFAYSNESAMFDYIESKSGLLPTVVTLATQAGDDSAAATLALTWMLRLRGTVSDSLCRYRQAQQLLPRDAEFEALITRYRSQKAFLANAALAPPTGLTPDKVKKLIADVNEEVVELEKDIRRALASKAPDVFAQREGATVALVQEKLPAGSALVEFCHTPIRDFKNSGWSEYHYLAFVLTAAKKGPVLIDLGLAKPINDGVEVLRKEFIDFQEKLRDCETDDEAKTLEQAQEKEFKKKSAALHAKLMAPLAKAIGDTKLLYVVADAALNRLPFECLVDADGKYLIERHRCAYLSSGRDLLTKPGKLATGTVVFAGPDYKLDAAERQAQAEKLLNKKETVLALRGSPGLRSAGFKPLPGAAAEAKDIQKALTKPDYGPVKTYVGAEALEEVLKAMPAPRVLHLATHGFFLDREPGDPAGDTDEAGAGSARRRLKRADNPLLRSGIVLAGANTIGDKDTAANVEDGWVTAEEISLLNLHGTDLVVLSACQTGLGDIKTGEGVYGLRRAFLHAGARTLVTSLFEVPDSETRDLMQHFYTGINAGNGKLRALHAAQVGMIDARRQARGAAHPFFWASFVLIGNPD